MRVIGCLIVWAFGALFALTAKKFNNRKPINYKQYPVAEGIVIGTYDFIGTRWMVRFKDETGREVIGADDMYAESTFHPQKHAIPKRGDTERIYYWENSDPSSHRINGTPIQYMFHFCKEDFYSLKNERDKWRKILLWGIVLFMYIVGILILFSP